MKCSIGRGVNMVTKSGKPHICYMLKSFRVFRIGTVLFRWRSPKGLPLEVSEMDARALNYCRDMNRRK